MHDLLDDLEKQPKPRTKLIITLAILNLITMLSTVGLAYIEVETIVISFFVLGGLAIALLIIAAKHYNLSAILLGISNLLYPGGMTAMIIMFELQPSRAHGPVFFFGLGTALISLILFIITLFSFRRGRKKDLPIS